MVKGYDGKYNNKNKFIMERVTDDKLNKMRELKDLSDQILKIQAKYIDALDYYNEALKSAAFNTDYAIYQKAMSSSKFLLIELILSKLFLNNKMNQTKIFFWERF
jgi:hypothetical protein